MNNREEGSEKIVKINIFLYLYCNKTCMRLEIKTVIIDDEPHVISSLEAVINDYLPELNIIGAFDNPLKALAELPSLNPDLIFLDISMTQMSGFELLDNIKELNFKVIFITSFDEYAIKAFRYSAVDYILKPIDLDILIDAVSKVVKSANKGTYTDHSYGKLLDYINTNNIQQKIVVPTKNEVFYLLPNDIIYVSAEGSYAKIFLNDNSPILVSKTLKDIESQISFDNFLRIHKSFLINVNFVKKFLKTDGGSVQMTNGDQIPISKRRRIEFNKKMGL